jgi:hypothetical protein
MAQNVEHYGPFNIQSGKVTSTNDRGETAHRSQWYSAPQDRFFAEQSIHIKINSAVGHNTHCNVVEVKRKTIMLHNDGIEVPVSVITDFRVEAHAETGSGAWNIRKTAWIEAEVEADLVKYER